MQDSNNGNEIIANANYDVSSAPVYGSDKNAAPQKRKPSLPKMKVLIVCLAGLILVGGGFAAFYFYNKAKDKSSDDPESLATITYITPEDSEDPEGDYLNYLKSKTAKAKNGIDKISALVQESAQYISMNDMESARAALDGIDESSLETNEEKYSYYNAYANLYDVDALNDPELCADYRRKAEEIIEIIDREAIEKMREQNANE